MMQPSRPRMAVAAAGAMTLLASLLVPAAAVADDDPTTLNDLIVSEYVEGSSFNKALEVFNGTNAEIDLSGYTLRQYSNGGTTASISLQLVGTLEPGGVHIVADPQANAAILAVADQTVGGAWNGDDALVLSRGDVVVDSFGQLGVDPGTGWGVGTDAATVNNTLRRSADVCAGDTVPDDAFDPGLQWTGHGVDVVDGLGAHTTTCAPGDPDGPGGPGEPVDPGACFDEATPVGAVQGAGVASPLVGRTVTVEGTVVGDFQHAGSYDGYYVQDSGDDDLATSDGVFVHAPGGADVAVGDLVRVTGTVSEFFTLTEISPSDVQVCATGGEVPAALELTMPLGDLEPYEGMLVTFPEELSILEYFEYGRFGEIVLGVGDATARQQQPTAVHEPGSAEAEALLAVNASHRIMLDDGLTSQNPPFLRHPDGQAFSLEHSFRGGDTVTGATGVLDFRFSQWGIQPTEGAGFERRNVRPEVPVVGGTTTVASFNVLNYFTTLTSQDSNARGADTAEEFERQEAKIVAAINQMDADVVGLIEIENNGDVAVGTLVDALNADAGEDRWAHVSTGVIGTDAITTAFIYQPSQVTPAGAHGVLDSTVDPRFDDGANRPALAQTFEDNETAGQVTVVVNHLKSKGSACAGDPDTGDGQGNCNLTRAAAADALGDWANGDPTRSGADHALIIGDLNSYDKEDPIDALRADGFVDLLLQFGGEHAYSYVFDGMLGYLDYAMASASLAGRVTGAAAWAINADEPSVLDYDMSFKPDAQDLLFAPDPYRSSDHDPVLVGLDLAAEVTEVTRWAGADRYQTAAVIAEQFGDVDTVYVATGLAPADALAGAAPAANGLVPGLLGSATAPDGSAAPVLLTRQGSLPGATRLLLEAVDPTNIVVLGGTVAVSTAVEDELETYGDVVRVAGRDRYETAALLSELFEPAEVVFLASAADRSFADALAGSAVAGGMGSPVLLTRTGELPASTARALAASSPARVVVLGGELAVSDNVLAEVRAAAGTDDVVRVAGADRYQTALALSAGFFTAGDTVLVATGATFPDALSSAAYAGAVDAPVLLTRTASLPSGFLEELDRLDPRQVVIVGGEGAVSAEVERQLQDWADQR